MHKEEGMLKHQIYFFTYLHQVCINLQAIEFAMEEGDDELWDVLIRLSIVDPSEYQRSKVLYK